MKQMKRITLLCVVTPFMILTTSCNGIGTYAYNFKQWNECEAITTLKEYMKDITNKYSANYIPVEDRIATFDMDGTFYGELYPTYTEYNMLEYRALDDPDYKDIAPDFVKEAAQAIRDHVREGKPYPEGNFALIHAHAAAEAYSGMSLKEFDEYTTNYLKTPAKGFANMTYGEGFYKPMIEVFDYLRANDFTFYVVSGSDRLLCRSLVCNALNIEPNRIIGMDVVLEGKDQGDMDGVDYQYHKDEDVIRTNELIIKNLKMNKVKQIVQEVGKQPVLSFGNSDGDCSMHNFALSNPKYRSAAFMLVADDTDRDYGLTSYEKIKELNDKWTEAGYTVISMKNDFKTIYGDNVIKTSIKY